MKNITTVICIICVLLCVMCSGYAEIIEGTPSITNAGAGGSNTYFATVRMGKKAGYYSYVSCDLSGIYITNSMTTMYTSYGRGANTSGQKGGSVSCTARCFPQLPDDYRTGKYTVSCAGNWRK